LLFGTLFIALGFNTLDQMIIRYKFYDDWRALDYWEMCPWWSPNWWSVYIASVVAVAAGGFLLGALCTVVFRKEA